MNVEQALSSVRDVFVNYPKRIEHNEEALKKVELEIQDLLHLIELTNFNASKGYRLAKELQKARQRRRAIKDELETLEPIREFIKYTKPTEKNISKTIGEVRKVKNVHGTRTYKLKVRTDIQEVIS